MKSNVDFPPALISESDITSRVLRQTRISMDVIRTDASSRASGLHQRLLDPGQFHNEDVRRSQAPRIDSRHFDLELTSMKWA